MTESFLAYEDFQIELVRKPHRRRLTLQVRADGQIRLLAGILTPSHKIHDFLKSADAWLQKHIRRLRLEAQEFAAPSFQQGSKVHFLGEPREVKYQRGEAAIWLFDIEEEILYGYIPYDHEFNPNASHPELIVPLAEFFRAVAIRLLTQRVEFWANKMGLYPTDLKFRAQNARWGSCSAQGRIVLNWKLIVFRLEVIDYVIVHELAHLQHQDHSARFWNLVSTWIPDFKMIKKELRQNQRRADWLNCFK